MASSRSGIPTCTCRPKDEISARNLLQVFDDRGVAIAGRDQLVHPMRKRMGAGGRDQQPAAGGEVREFAPQLHDLRARALATS